MPIPSQTTKTIYSYTSITVVPFVITSFVFDINSKFSISLDNVIINPVITLDVLNKKISFSPSITTTANSKLVVSMNTPLSRINFIDPSNIDKVAINSQLNEFTLLAQQINTNINNIIRYDQDLTPVRNDLLFPNLGNNTLFYKDNTGNIVTTNYEESPTVTSERNKFYDKKKIYTNPITLNSEHYNGLIFFNTKMGCNLINGTGVGQFYQIIQNTETITFTGSISFNSIRYGRTEYFLVWNGTAWDAVMQQSIIIAIGKMNNTIANIAVKNESGIDPYNLFSTVNNITYFESPRLGHVMIDYSFSNPANTECVVTITNITNSTSNSITHNGIEPQSGSTFLLVNKNDSLIITTSASVLGFYFKYTYLPIGDY